MPRPSRAFAAYMASDKEFRGIGPVQASRLEARFGEHLRDVIAAHDPRVVEVLGDKTAQAAFIAFEHKSHEADVVDWLERRGVDEEVGVQTAIKIARCWGGDAAPALTANPYALLAFLSWHLVDRIAGRLGVQPDDPRRREAAIEAVLYAYLDKNDTAVPISVIEAEVTSLVGNLSRETLATTISRVLESGGAAQLGELLQPYGAAFMETEVAHWIAAARDKAPYSDLALPHDAISDIDSAIASFEEESPYPLVEKQRAAIRLGLTSRVALLAGYAGTGKTTSLRGVCEIARAQGRDTHLMALSGRAAQRMGQSTGFSASTIAGFLNSFRNGRRQIAPGDLLVIDEASMIDLPLLWRILGKIGDSSLILVGDPAQLPPIGFGLTFHALCKDTSVPQIVLDEVVRQTADTGIPRIADHVRHGRQIELPAFHGLSEDVTFTPCEAENVLDLIGNIYDRVLADGAEEHDVQILSPTRRGRTGSEAINRSFHSARHNKSASEHFPGRRDIAAGDPIIWTRNNWDRELMNGSLGQLLSVYDGVAHASFDGVDHDLTEQDAQFIELAYAISVHKAQGSQWPVVIVPVFPSKILDRSLIYTAITRATSQVILLGDRAALHQSISREPSVSLRNVGLHRRLRQVLRS